MTTLRVLQHVATQRDYELHPLDFSTTFLQGSLNKEILLRCPRGFTGLFPAGTQWSLRRPVYGLCQAPREWHDTLRTTLAALGFAPSSADPSLFLRTDTSLSWFYVFMHVNDLVFATTDTEALALVKSELQKRHTCTDLGELRSYLGLQITRDRARRTITLTQSHMVHQVLQHFGFRPLLLLLLLLLLLPPLSQPLPPRAPPRLPTMTSLCRSGGSGDGGGGSSGGGGGRPSSRCGAVRWGASGGGQQRQRESLTPQRLREWCTSRGGGGGSSGTHSAAVQLGRVDIFALDYDAILTAMYAFSASAEGDCSRCVPPDPGVAAAALGASASGTPRDIAPAQALHTFTLDSGASRCFFRDSTTLTPLPAPVSVRLADPSGGPVVARSSTVLPCPPDVMVTTTTPRGQRVSICTCTRMGRHLATFTHRPGSSLYTLATEPPQVAAAAQVSASGQVFASLTALACPALSSLRRGVAARRSSLLVSHDNCSPANPPHRPKGEVSAVLISWIRTVRLQLRERFGQDLPVLRLHSNRGGEFSFDLLRDFCRGEGITQSFTLPDSPQKNGIAECRIGLVMEVAHTSMIHAAAPHFMWPFVVRYAAHQLNLWPGVSLPETSPTLRWTGKVGDASVFRVWGSRAFVCDMSADKLSARAIPCVFLGFVCDAPGWQFYHPTSRRVLPSQDVMFDESVPFYRLFPYHSAPSPPPPLFLAPDPPQVDPLTPQGPAPSGVSRVDPIPGTVPVQVAVVSGAAPGAASGGAASGGAASGVAEPGGAGSEGAGSGDAEPGGSEPKGVEPEGAESEGAESRGAEPWGAASRGGPAGASPRLSSQQLREWLVRRAHRQSAAPGAGGAGDTGAGGAAVTTGAGGTGGTAATSPGGARTSGAGAARTGGVGCAGAGDPTDPGAVGAGGAGAGVAGVGGPGAEGAGAAGAGVGGTGAGGAGAAGAGAVDP
ncbi:unnamed protein product [Closterium sp. NIES-54]